MDPLLIGIMSLGGLFVLIALHVPIGPAIGVTGLVAYTVMEGFAPAVSLFGTEASLVFASAELAIIPLFLLMGNFATASGLSADIYRLAYAFVGHRPGGLALSTIVGCAGFGAVCGSSMATAATMTRVALPEMLKRGYRPTLAAGSVAAGGTLGMLIPPSIVMVLYAFLTEQFLISLFIAAIVPGAITVVLYAIAIAIYVRIYPNSGPAGPLMSWAERWRAVRDSWAVITLATIVTGGIYTGIFTVAEAAAAGAILAFAFTALRRRLSWSVLWEVLIETASNTGMLYLVIVAANVFTYSLTVSNLPETIVESIRGLAVPPLAIVKTWPVTLSLIIAMGYRTAFH